MSEEEEAEEEYQYSDDDDDGGGGNYEYLDEEAEAGGESVQSFSNAGAKETSVTAEKSASIEVVAKDKRLSESGEKRQTPKKELVVLDGGYTIRVVSEIIPLMRRLIDEMSLLLNVSEDAAQILLITNKWDKEKITNSFFSDHLKMLLDSGLDLYSPHLLDSLPENLQSSLLETNTIRNEKKEGEGEGERGPEDLDASDCKSSGVATHSAASEKAEAAAEGGSGDKAAAAGGEGTEGEGKDSAGRRSFFCRICCETCDEAKGFSLGCAHAFCRGCYSDYLTSQVQLLFETNSI